MSSQVRVTDLLRKKDQNEKIVVVTAYDYTFARLVDVAGVDVILVGDSLGTVIQGCATTLPVTLEEMIYHTRAVVRGAKQALVIADMPFMSYQLGPKEALAAAGRVMKETGAAGVKLEGGESAAQTIRAIVQAGIPVMAHAGLQPQSVHQLGGYRVQGRSEDDAVQVLRDAVAVEEAGAFSVVLEGVTAELAAGITERLSIPTIGIGAGAACSGQVLVLYDLLGLTHLEPEKYPKFVRRYAEGAKGVVDAVRRFGDDVRKGVFPAAEQTYFAGPRRVNS